MLSEILAEYVEYYKEVLGKTISEEDRKKIEKQVKVLEEAIEKLPIE